ncbi:pyridoxamine 5'-phosphate oxidase family protein [Clostridium algoriphilum]|uniref:pyridoxamine 5'-phosphate oxidase family protein n=1 Tax=Clostridium algoriphilum TaxID=198347 RepID=UPI001CF1C6EB|nr:pyridoxamine 5'-phosphate oxidase family protein [Clostridium algoriphilum]MCB2293130.1 pyridoxamine 5'-phosphate oxidase family protein [Clostridium algoriphilum]
MRRVERQMSEVEALELLATSEYGIFATCTEENQPYGVPLSYVLIDRKIYLHCARVGTKLDNIILNNKVSFTVVGKTKILQDEFSTEYESVIVFGRTTFLKDEEKDKPLMEFIRKYSPEFIEEGRIYIDKAKVKTTLIKIEICSLSGKHRV